MATRRKKIPETTSTTTLPVEPINLDPGSKSFSQRISGISSTSLQKIFDKKITPREGKLKAFHDTLNSRIKDGRQRALLDYRAWAAVDLAFETSFRQVTPTIIGKLMDSNSSAKEVMDALTQWGISDRDLFVDAIIDGQPAKVINQHTFYKVLLPAVLTYTNVRWAKLYNDRDQFPLLKYEPFVTTAEHMLISEALTNIFEKQGHQMGDRMFLKQMILQALKYSVAFAFPMEAWYSEKSVDESGNEYCVKEGLRYQIPHPTRMFWDMQHRPSTFNTDTGCEYAGHWRLMRWGDINNNPIYWNRDQVEYGRTDWFKGNQQYFKEIYPCTMQFPLFQDSVGKSRDEINNFYNTGDHDKAVFVTDVFWKLIPSDWGIGDYKYPVWFRFVVASDDTVIFAEPLPYPPVLYMGLDVDENQGRNASFSLQIIPFADHLGNILSQIVLACRQNAMKLVAYDSDQIDEANIKAVKAESNDVSKIKFIPFSAKQARHAQQDPTRMLMPMNLPVQDTNAMTATLNTVINVMERMLGISPQEVGAAGVHVQTAEESRILASNTSQRVEFTGTHVDDTLDAWKKQKHRAAMAFMDEEFIVEVSGNKEYLPALQAVGFTLLAESPDRYVIRGNKKKLAMEAFVSVREGKNRINNPQIAQVLLQTVQVVAGNQMLAQSVGVKQIVDWVNRATQLAGGPKDAKLSVQQAEENPQMLMQQVQELQAQLQQAQQQLQQADQQVQTDQIKAQADLQKAELAAQTTITTQQIKSQADIEAAKIGAETKLQTANISKPKGE